MLINFLCGACARVTPPSNVWCFGRATLEQTGCLARASLRFMQLPLIPPGMPARAWPPVLATRGPGGPCAWHSHHSLRFALALDGEVRIRTVRQGKWSSAPGVLTAPDSAHVLDAQGAELLLVFLDPESVSGSPFRDALSGPVRLISDAERNALTRDVVPRRFTLGRHGLGRSSRRNSRPSGAGCGALGSPSGARAAELAAQWRYQ